MSMRAVIESVEREIFGTSTKKIAVTANGGRIMKFA